LTISSRSTWLLLALCIAATNGNSVHANAYRERDHAAEVAHSGMIITPSRDWNCLDAKPGKDVEVWTLDGEQLNDVTFYGGIDPGKPLVKELNKKREPLPKFTASTLLIEVPELLEGTYRTYKRIGSFTLTGSKPDRFLGREGIGFTYEFTDQDELPRKGEARAVLIGKRLYMVTFEAPRLHYFERTLADFRALADTATLKH
jgi:hypothetical protein